MLPFVKCTILGDTHTIRLSAHKRKYCEYTQEMCGGKRAERERDTEAGGYWLSCAESAGEREREKEIPQFDI